MTQLVPAVDRHLDFRGLRCPEPVVRTAQAARLLATGGTLEIQADDDAFPADLTSWCRSTRSELVKMDQADGVFRALVRVPALPSPGDSRTPKPPAPPAVAAAAKAPRTPSSPVVEHADVLDFRGKQCPEPIVLLAQAARAAKAPLVVLADDEAFPADVRSWCRSAGATLEDFSQEGTVFRARIRPRGIPGGAPTTAAARTSDTAPPPAPSTPPGPAAHAIASRALAPAPVGPALAVPLVATTNELAPVSGGTQFTLDLRTLQAPELTRMLDGLGSLPAGTKALVSLGNSASLQATVRWSAAAGHELLAFDPITLEARLKLAGPRAAASFAETLSPDEPRGFVRATNAPDCALLVLSDDLEALLAALLVANGAAAQGLKTMVFFTFWGLNLLRGDVENASAPVERISFFQRVFKWLMPRGPRRPRLGKLDFGGVGTSILGGIMRDKNIQDLPALLASAESQGVSFVACTMSMSVMGIGRRDLAPRPNLSFAGVATFVEAARGAAITLKF